MNYRAILEPAAEDELRIAHAWYQQKGPTLGNAFLDSVGAVISAIERNPLLYPVVHQDIRRAVVKRFPYCLYFVIEGSSLQVIALFHGRRDPAIWMARRQPQALSGTNPVLLSKTDPLG